MKSEKTDTWALMRGLVSSARLVTWPSIFTNALVAWACVAQVLDKTRYEKEHDEWMLIWLSGLLVVALVGTCLLWYGMWSNDAVDARWDAKHSPHKPVPQGLITAAELRFAARVALAAGVLIVVVVMPVYSVWVFPCLISIALYNAVHKATAWSVVLMALARGTWAGLACVLVLAWEDRGGMLAELSNGSGFGAWIPLPAVAWWYMGSLATYTLVVSCVALAEDRMSRVRGVVGVLLAGICVHDAIWLMILGHGNPTAWLAWCAWVACPFSLWLLWRGVRAS